MFYFLSGLKDVFFGFNVFRYITFRSAMAAVTTFLICLICGPIFIRFFRQRQIGEHAKRKHCQDLDRFKEAKEGTPTMGGIFMVGSILLSVFLWGDLGNRYVLLTSGTCFYLMVLGMVDDWVKLIRPDHSGLRAKTKFLWQILLACFIGSYVFFDPNTSTRLDVPFLKSFIVDIGIFYFVLVAGMIIGTTNAVNLTDGLDGLAIGCVLIVSVYSQGRGADGFLHGHGRGGAGIFVV